MNTTPIEHDPSSAPDPSSGANGGRAAVPGTLYVVATPIGNLADLTYRAGSILATVDRVLAEDTRQTRTLLAHYAIKAKLEAVHAHNEASRVEHVVACLAAGESAALVTDAGTPGISDPGARLVAGVRAAGHPIVPIPGVSAVIAALSVAGIDGPFHFVGFLPPRATARREALGALASLTATLVFYEAPHRVAETVADFVAVLGGDRTLVVARELTKRFESIASMPLAASVAWFEGDANRLRGEFVLLVSGAPNTPADATELDRVLALLLEELPLKQAVAIATRWSGAKRNDVYARALALRGAAE